MLLAVLLSEMTVLEAGLVDCEVELLTVEDEDTDVLVSVEDEDTDVLLSVDDKEADDVLLVEIEVLDPVLELILVEEAIDDDDEGLEAPGIESAPGTYLVRS